jgi:hypothetical protein
MPRTATQAATGGSLKRITRATGRAIELMVYEGFSIADAAQAAELKVESLRAALRKPHVAAHKTSLTRAMIDGEAERSVGVLVKLRDSALSEHVRLEAAKHLAALGGFRPPSDDRPLVNVAITPGYVIDLSGHPHPSASQVIDGPEKRPDRLRLLPLSSDDAASGGRVAHQLRQDCEDA